MIIDFKYHIASLVAVFLALAIGILIGSTTLSGGDIIAEQQKEIISRLEQDFGRLRQENSNLHSQVKSMENRIAIDRQFQEVTLPIILDQRLDGQNIAIIETNENYLDTAWHSGLIDNLKDAGANIHSVTAVSQDLGLKDNQKRELIMAKLKIPQEKEKELFNLVAKDLASEIIVFQERNLLPLLEQVGIVRFFPGHRKNISSVIIIGGGESAKDGSLDRTLIREWKKKGIRVIGVEPNEVQQSFMPNYQELGISTIDSIDTIPSQVTLVWLLQQGKEGDYGIKPTADQIFPDIITY